MIAFIIILCMYDEYGRENFSEYWKRHDKKFINKAILICIFGTVFTVFVPSKETMIEMAVAKNITEKNVELAKDTVKSMIDYTIESVTKLSNKDDEKDSK